MRAVCADTPAPARTLRQRRRLPMALVRGSVRLCQPALPPFVGQQHAQQQARTSHDRHQAHSFMEGNNRWRMHAMTPPLACKDACARCWPSLQRAPPAAPPRCCCRLYGGGTAMVGCTLQSLCTPWMSRAPCIGTLVGAGASAQMSGGVGVLSIFQQTGCVCVIQAQPQHTVTRLA